MKYKYKDVDSKRYVHKETGLVLLVVRTIKFTRSITIGGDYEPTVVKVSVEFKTMCDQPVLSATEDWPPYLTVRTGSLKHVLEKLG